MNALAMVKGVESRIHVLRGQRVMLGSDLAVLYGVTTRALMQAVRRNKSRFPADFCFELTRDEWEAMGARDSLRSQTVILKKGRGQHAKYRPWAFTEQGVAMLSSVLRSERAALVNVTIMRAFVYMRALAKENGDVLERMRLLERNTERHLLAIWKAIKQLTADAGKRRQIGFRAAG